MSGPSQEHLDVSSLLTIDVSSELRKLAQAQLQGSWQLPAELVRRAIRGKARRVEIAIGRHSISIQDDGEGLQQTDLEHFAALLDRGGEPARRHAALTALERAGALALLAVAGLEPERVRLLTHCPQGPRVLEYDRRHGSPQVREFAPPVPAGTSLEVSGAKLDRSRARGWLTSVCRFAPADVLLDGQPVPRGFSRALSRHDLRDPVRGVVSIPAEGDDARAWLLQDGVVSTHVTVTPAPCFEAAIEMSALAGRDATAASLRDTIERQLDELIGQAVDHMIALGKEARYLDSESRERVTKLLLEAARQRRRSAEIAQLPLFRGFERDPAGELIPTDCDLLAIRAAVEEDGGERVVTALFPEQDPADYAVGQRVFVLDENERSLLSELLGLRFRQPRRREDGGLLSQALTGLSRSVGDLGQGLVAAIWRRTPVAEDELSTSEHRFLQVIRSALGGQRTAGSPVRELHLCEGGGRIRRAGDALWLPRENGEVMACVEAVANDPTWAYPALLVLLDGRALPSAHSRFAWTSGRASGT